MGNIHISMCIDLLNGRATNKRQSESTFRCLITPSSGLVKIQNYNTYIWNRCPWYQGQ